jgi:hypothetical protein
MLVVSLLANRLGLNSQNSSKPHSTGFDRKKNSRNKSDNPAGGHKRREGKTLSPFEEPDVVKDIPVNRAPLPPGKYRDAGVQCRQVVDSAIQYGDGINRTRSSCRNINYCLINVLKNIFPTNSIFRSVRELCLTSTKKRQILLSKQVPRIRSRPHYEHHPNCMLIRQASILAASSIGYIVPHHLPGRISMPTTNEGKRPWMRQRYCHALQALCAMTSGNPTTNISYVNILRAMPII